MFAILWAIVLPTFSEAQCADNDGSWLNFDHKPGGVCLDNGIQAANRQQQGLHSGRNLTIGVCDGYWTSQEMSSRIIGILIREKLGVHVEPCLTEYVDNTNTWASIIGCKDAVEYTCDDYDPNNPPYDFFPEYWVRQDNLQANLDVIDSGPARNDPKAHERVVSLGSLGYASSDMLGVWSNSVESALNRTNGTLSLHWYKDLQSDAAMEYFTPLRHMDISYGVYQYCGHSDADRLEAWGYMCNESHDYDNPWRMSLNGQWNASGEIISRIRPFYDCAEILAESPDAAQKFLDDGFVCRGQGWWLSESCAAKSPTDEYLDVCIPVLAYDPSLSYSGLVPGLKYIPAVVAHVTYWDAVEEFLADYGSTYKYRDNAQQNVALVGWWIPDASMPLYYGDSVSLVKVQFTPSLSERLNTAVTIGHERMLRTSPAISWFLQNFKLPSDAINPLLDDVVSRLSNDVNGDIEGAMGEAACQWLRSNKELWQDFIGAASCWGGTYWLESAGRCLACPKGTTSERGVSGIDGCTPCPVGTSTGDAGVCVPCAAGKYSGPDDAECINCPRGTYGNSTSLISCFACPSDLSTKEVGATSSTLCDCREGFYNVEASFDDRGSFIDESPTKNCGTCPVGMTCAGYSSEPIVNNGFWSSPSDPLSVYMCADPVCIGGSAGACVEGGRFGFLCMSCPNGYNMNATGCSKCSTWNRALVVFVLVIVFCGLIIGYYTTNTKVLANATVEIVITASLGMVVTMFQMFGMFYYLTIPWTRAPSTESVTSSGKPFVGGLQHFGIGCIFGFDPVARFAFMVLTPFVIAAYFLVMLLLSRVVQVASRTCSLRVWEIGKIMNTLGAVYLAVFITLVAITIAPFQVYEHPNQKSSMQRYPKVLTSDGKYSAMVVLSFLGICFFIVPYVACCIWGIRRAACHIPKRVEEKMFMHPEEMQRIQKLHATFRFILVRYRPGCWWWGGALLVRQLLLAFTPVLPAEEPHAQVIFVCFTLTCYAIAAASYFPWKSDVLNVLDLTQCLGLLLFVVISASFIDASKQISSYEVSLFVVIITMFTMQAYVIVTALGVRLWYGPKASLELAWLSSGIPSNVSEVWRDICLSCVQLSTEDLHKLVMRMPVTDVRTLLDAAGAWHALAPGQIPARSCMRSRMVALEHSSFYQKGRASTSTQDIVARTLSESGSRESYSGGIAQSPDSKEIAAKIKAGNISNDIASPSIISTQDNSTQAAQTQTVLLLYL